VKGVLGKDGAGANDLLQLAFRRGQLVRVNADYCLHPDADLRLRRTVVDALRATDGMTVGAIRELLATTRKYALPFCQYLDRAGVTRRVGDRRIAADPTPADARNADCGPRDATEGGRSEGGRP
jgi:selenocysteine-specific elongation factor